MLIIQAKTENQLRYILRATRNKKQKRSTEIDSSISLIRSEISKLAKIVQNMEEIAEKETFTLLNKIRGHEGMVGKQYFSIFPCILNLEKKDFLYFSGRNRRPPKDPFNALLSFGYALLYKDCVSVLTTVGLDPSLGFFHTPRSSAYPLALDLMELFRTILWDIPLVASVNRKQWQKEDFEITNKQVWLNKNGRVKAIRIYEERKQEKWKHPVLNYSLSYDRTLELEAKLLEKEWGETPGLFAKLRLR